MDLSRIKEEYKRIKAPESLRERVMNVQPVNIRPARFDRFRMIKSLSSVAACLAVAVIIITALVVRNGDFAAITVLGTQVGNQPVAVVENSQARSIPVTASADNSVKVEFTVECKKDCRVKVNCGEISEPKASYSDGDTLVWLVNDIPDEGAMLYLEYGSKTSTYTLVQSAETGVWTINKK